MTEQTRAGASRRQLLTGVAVAAAGIGAVTVSSTPTPADAQAASPPRPGLGNNAAGQIFFTADTTAGKVMGIANGAIKEFKGVPYGADTGGRNRFMPPKRPVAWAGVRDCIGYGQISPQTPADLASDYPMLIAWDRHVGPGGMGEDCLNLNVWTPGVNDGGKRAVMVSFHGGGWATGSGNGPMYDGAQLARFGDVVVVTVNHRLGAFGYADLADLGAPPEFRYAGVCGLMDMVASLEWVRDNIAGFGGDPGQVFIFGQSGGGSKVSTLLATPPAKGLFHRAAVQSGSTLRQATRDEAGADAAKLLAALGIGKSNIADIQQVAWTDLLQAQIASGGNFRPVVGTDVLPHHPFDPAGPPESVDVPVIISTTLHDAALRLSNFDLDEAGLLAIFSKRWGARGDAILHVYREESPTESPFRIQAKAFTDATRGNAMLQAQRKAEQGGAKAYLYTWDWATPAYDSKFGAVHGHDVDASFHIARSNMVGSGRAEGRLMADRLASAWVAFAKTGDPNNPAIPRWAPYDAAMRATMIFDTETRVENDPRKAFRELWA
jgi:para-nitrobenzyl esterase